MFGVASISKAVESESKVESHRPRSGRLYDGVDREARGEELQS